MQTPYCSVSIDIIISKQIGLCFSIDTCNGVTLCPALFGIGNLCRNIRGINKILLSFCYSLIAKSQALRKVSKIFSFVANRWKIDFPSGNLETGEKVVTFPLVSSCCVLSVWYRSQYNRSVKEMKCWTLPGWSKSRYIIISSDIFFWPETVFLRGPWGTRSPSFSASKNYTGRLFSKLMMQPSSRQKLNCFCPLPLE